MILEQGCKVDIWEQTSNFKKCAMKRDTKMMLCSFDGSSVLSPLS